MDEYNAFYDSAQNYLCFGYDPNNPELKMAHDPSIIYHEMGHALIKGMINFRNNADGTDDVMSDLGYGFYSEAGSLGEGISDYFSYFVNERKHWAEWALGRFYRLSRPLTEDDDLHANGISTSRDGRLSYPTFLNYDTYDVTVAVEDVHNNGMISS